MGGEGGGGLESVETQSETQRACGRGNAGGSSAPGLRGCWELQIHAIAIRMEAKDRWWLAALRGARSSTGRWRGRGVLIEASSASGSRLRQSIGC